MIPHDGYFDWAGTSLYDEEILRDALDFSLCHWGNPSSIHKAGQDARDALEACRAEVAASLGIASDTVYFTSGGTESDHMMLLSVLTRPQKGSILMGSSEHPALREMALSMRNTGWDVSFVPTDKEGFVTPEAVAARLQDDTVLVCVMAVNNEVGAVQPLREIADAVRSAAGGKRRPMLFSDSVQAAGKIPLDLASCGVDAASFSIHKIGGPRGFGVLYAAKPFESFLKGGGQEKGVRSGTENLFGARAAALCFKKYFISPENPAAEERLASQREYTKEFIEDLKTLSNCVLIPKTRGSAVAEERFSPWIVQAAFLGIPGQVMVRALSEKGIFISTGSACSSAKKARPVLDAMGIPSRVKECAVRFSFGYGTTKEGMRHLFECVRDVCRAFGAA